jgi:hypothetical protein
MNPEIAAPGLAPAAGPYLDPAALAARIKPAVHAMNLAWGLAWLIGIGLMFARSGPGGRAYVSLPPWLPLAVLGVSVVDWVLQADRLPEVDLVVSHGGSGSVLAALAAGRPQLVLPQGADQFSNAHAVAGAGAGWMIMPAELSADRIAADARALLDDAGVRARAGELAGEIAALPAPAQVARDLGRLAAARLAH